MPKIALRVLPILAAAGIAAGAIAGAYLRRDDTAPLVGTLRPAAGLAEAATHPAGPYRVVWSPAGGGTISVHHAEAPERVLWRSIPGQAFVGATRGDLRVREARGSFSLRERRRALFPHQRIDAMRAVAGGLNISGELEGPNGSLPYEVSFRCPGEDGPLRLELRVSGGANRSFLMGAALPGEQFFGFGAQFSRFNLTGLRVPVWVQEQGIGRGRQPLTTVINAAAGSGGSWHSTYAAVPHFLTTALRSFHLEGHAYSIFDLRTPGRVQVEVFDSTLRAALIGGERPADLIAAYTAETGRMRRPPAWLLDGAVAGMQGGTARVRAVWEQLRKHGTPVSAFWLQDWEGQRRTAFGKQLWWNWQLDRERYPDWDGLRDELAAHGVRLMGYINPFLVDVSGRTAHTRNLYREAEAQGFLVVDAQGRVIQIPNTDFSAAMVDLSHPGAVAWLKSVIRDELIGAGLSGWMADFGEALPWEAALHDGMPAALWHNRYPEAWARLNREAIEETGRGDDFVFFMRSGFRESPRHATLFWLGDQLVSWDRHDGMKSAVTGLLSSGLSGYAFNHSDIGGYTTIRTPVYRLTRDHELLMRWMELNAFTAVYRTHEGNDPEANVQFYTDDRTMAHFTRFAKVYRAWGFLRDRLADEAAATGLPVVRHPWIHHPEDPAVWRINHEQFLVGDALLVAPVLDPGVETVSAYLPAGRWVHVWTGEAHGDPERGLRVTVAAPLGQPAVFHPEGHPDGLRFRENLQEAGLMP
jgi:alpha-glucosidase